MFFCDCLNVKIQNPDISQASRGNFWPLAPSPGLIPYESPEEFFKTVRLFLLLLFILKYKKKRNKNKNKKKTTAAQRAKEKQ